MQKDLDQIKAFLDDVLYGLKDDDIVYLTIIEPVEGDDPIENVWHGKVKDLFEKDLTTIVDNLEPTARLVINGRSGTDVFALAAPLAADTYSWKLQVPDPDRIVCVAVLDPLGDAESLMDYVVDIPIPGIGGVTVVGEGPGPVDPDDEAVDKYLDKLDEVFAELEGDDYGPDDDEGGPDDGGAEDDPGDRSGQPGDGQGEETGGGPAEDRRDGPGEQEARRHDHGDPLSEGWLDGDDDDGGEHKGDGQADRHPGDHRRDGQAGARGHEDGRRHVEPEQVIQDLDGHREELPRQPGQVARVADRQDSERASVQFDGFDEEPVSAGGPCEVEGDGTGQVGLGFTIGLGSAKYFNDKFSGQRLLAAKKVEQNVSGALGNLMTLFGEHKVGPKEGGYFLQGRCEMADGGQQLHRHESNMRDMCLAGLDIDAGVLSFDELKDKLRAFGHTVAAYTTHSHMKTTGAVERAKLASALKKVRIEGDIKVELLRAFLQHAKQYPEEIAETVEIVAQDAKLIRFKHRSWPKFRIIFPLAQDFDTQEPGAKHEWAERLRGLAEKVGIPHDESCKDFARLFYLPRHDEGNHYASWIYWGETLLNIHDVPRVPRATRKRADNPFTAFGREVGTGEGDNMLRKAMALVGNKLDLPLWLDKYAPECLTGEDRANGGVYTVCPHFLWEGKHSNTTIDEAPVGSYAMGPPDAETIIWHCSHASCQEFDRMDRIGLVIENVADATIETLFDPECLVLTNEDPEAIELLAQLMGEESEAAEVAEQTKAEAAMKVVDGYDPSSGRASDWRNVLKLLAPLWRDLTTDVRAHIVDGLKKKSGADKRDIKRDIDRAVLALQTPPEEQAAAIKVDAKNLRDALGGDYAVLNAAGRVGIVDMDSVNKGTRSAVPSIMGKQDFELLTSNRRFPVEGINGDIEMMPASKVFFEWEDRPTFNALVFEPDLPSTRKDVLNVWQGFRYDLKQRGDGDWSLLDKHIFEVICSRNEDHYLWLMTWIADIFQNPGTKRGSCVILRGAKGTGKSFLCDVLAHVLDPYSFKITSQNTLVSDFNDHLFGRLLIVAEEAVWGGDKRHEGKLKALITENKMEMSKKFFSTMEMSNYSRFIFTSNEGWVIPTAIGKERRFFMLDVSDERQEDIEYFHALQEQLDNGGYEAFAYDMTKLQPPKGLGWNMLRSAPQTDSLNMQKAKSSSAAQRFFVELIENGCFQAAGDMGQLREIRLSLDDVNRVHYATLKGAFFDYVKMAGSHRDAEPYVFYEHAAKILLAERNGKPRAVRNPIGMPEPVGLDAISHPGLAKPANHDVAQAVVFPGLREVVERHAEAGAFNFDLGWVDVDAAAT